MNNQLLKSFMEEKELDQKAVARLLGVSVATVSLYLKGEYKGVVANIDKKVEEVIGRAKIKELIDGYNDGFVRTKQAKRGLAMIDSVHAEGEMGVLYGQAGMGKTQILKQYVKENSSAVLIETDPSCTPKVLLRRIAKAIGSTETGTNDNLFEGIVNKLTGADMVLLVDEAELLSTRSLEFIRRIQDLSKCGVVLAGMPRLLVNLKGRKEDLKQLYSRASVACNLGNEMSNEDLALLIESGVGTSEFNATFIKHAKGNARRLSMLMKGAIRMARVNREPMNEEMIEQYAEFLIH
ncbi:transcriptional regulator [Pasteurellaceae bacterium 15-036681]|nr:transcriptional regulator [Pasteurellaceae bacterium 15-036681]